jgi:hypothetical protein
MTISPPGEASQRAELAAGCDSEAAGAHAESDRNDADRQIVVDG